MSDYVTLSAEAEAELTERRSRFICAVAPAATPEEAAAFVAKRKALHHDAKHTVFAWILRQGDLRRAADDGEPQGTGGQPVLEVLRREGLTDVCAAVSRYFGGVLLGAGGLTRAYAQSAALAVAAAPRVVMRQAAVCRVTVRYPQFGMVERLLESLGARLLATDFSDVVALTVLLPAQQAEALAAALGEVTGGAAQFVLLRQEFAAF